MAEPRVEWYRGVQVEVVEDSLFDFTSKIRWADGNEAWVGSELLRPLTPAEYVKRAMSDRG